MDARLTEVARTVLRKLESPQSGLPAELRIGAVSLAQLSRLAYLQAGDPLVEQVLAMLREGRPVYMDRPAVEASLGLAAYPPRLQEQFARWFVRISGYGIALTGRPEAQAPSPASAVPASPLPSPPAAPPVPEVRVLPVVTPDRQIFSQILGDAVPEPHACVKEPGKACCGSGRCKTLGF